MEDVSRVSPTFENNILAVSIVHVGMAMRNLTRCWSAIMLNKGYRNAIVSHPFGKTIIPRAKFYAF